MSLVYMVTESDMKRLMDIIEKIEAQTRAKHEDARVSNRPLGELLAHYRYQLCTWIGDMKH